MTMGKLDELIAPWADYHGDLPDFDHPLRCVFEAGVQYAVELLAKMLGVETWEICDGTEEYDGDLGGTLLNIVLEAMPKDEHGDALHPKELPGLIVPSVIALARQSAEQAARVVALEAALREIKVHPQSGIASNGYQSPRQIATKALKGIDCE